MLHSALRIFCWSLAIALAGTVSLAQQPSFPKPGSEHAGLAKSAGTWDAVMTIQGGMKSSGELISKMECGGFWRTRNFKGDFGGLEFQGQGLDGYDRVKKKYISIWVDSVTTTPTIFEGTYDEATKTYTLTGESRDFDGKPEQIKTLTKVVDEDTELFEMYRVYADGKEVKMMTIEYKRRKAAK